MPASTAALHNPRTPAMPQLLPRHRPGPASAAIGHVRALALQPGAHQALHAMPAVTANAGRGFAGDFHADALSPRQVLVAGAPAYARHGLATHTLRENVLLDTDPSRLPSGTLLRVGSEAVLWLTFACEACGYLDARRPGIAAAIGRERGMLARVLRGGAIRVGDPVVRVDGQWPADAIMRSGLQPGLQPDLWSDDWRERVAAILARVPAGLVVEYRQLARLAGVQPVYCRTFPRLARNLGFGHVTVALSACPDMPRWMGHELFEMPVSAIG